MFCILFVVTSGRVTSVLLGHYLAEEHGSCRPGYCWAAEGDCPSAISERASITAMKTAANFVSLGPFRILDWNYSLGHSRAPVVKMFP